MNVRWLWLDFVDPDLPLTWAERRSVRGQARFLMMLGQFARKTSTADLHVHLPPKAPRAPSFFLVTYVVTVIAMSASQRWLFWTAPIFAGLIIVPFAAWVALVLHKRHRNKWATFTALRLHGYDVCRTCGYWLRGLADDVKHCPECGSPRESMPAHLTRGVSQD